MCKEYASQCISVTPEILSLYNNIGFIMPCSEEHASTTKQFIQSDCSFEEGELAKTLTLIL